MSSRLFRAGLTACVIITGLAAAEKPVGLEGTWLFQTVGTSGDHGTSASDYTRSKRIVFKDGYFTDNALGYQPAGGKLSKCEPGGAIAFVTDYSVGGGAWNISWRGTISKDGNEISGGDFSFMMGRGTYTAKREAIVAANRSLTVVKGDKIEAQLSLNVQPLAAVTVTIKPLKGDAGITTDAKPLTFTADNWQTRHSISFSASDDAKPGATATFEASAEGQAPVVLTVKAKSR